MMSVAVLLGSSTLPLIVLRVMVGELLRMNRPPPAWASHVPPQVCRMPRPPEIVKPSSRSALVEPPPPAALGKYTAAQGVVVDTVQVEVMQGLSTGLVGLIVVTSGPSVETTLTPKNMRTASL